MKKQWKNNYALRGIVDMKISLIFVLLIVLMTGCATGHIKGSLVINKPVGEVFEKVSDQRNEPSYNSDMIYAKLLTNEPIGEGSQFLTRVKSGKDTTNLTITYTGYKKEEYINSKSVSDNMEIIGGLKFSKMNDGTLFEWSWKVKLKGKLKLFGPFVSIMGKKKEKKIWQSLKYNLENNK